MAVTAKIKVQLMANDLVVAESESAALWQAVFRAIEEDKPLEKPDDSDTAGRAKGSEHDLLRAPPGGHQSGTAVGRFAKELGIGAEVVEGACGPSTDAPYIHLDKHCWEKLKKNTGARGPTAVTPVVLAATLLVLWWKRAGNEGQPSMSDVAPVLSTIDLEPFNLKRSIDNCRWLQVRNGTISLNPARTSNAIAVAKAYCTQQKVEQSDA
jgi:hypothetical protein